MTSTASDSRDRGARRLLDIAGLRVEFGSEAKPLVAVDGIDFTIDEGEIVGIVGESGSGKSVTALAALGLIDAPGRVRAKRLAWRGRDMMTMSDRDRRAIAGGEIGMIFQDPLSSLDPCFTVAFQLTETLRIHEGGSARARRERALELLAQVEIPNPRARLDAYPHQLSGGMAQRVMIAMAIACGPRLLVADEPTTALDVTVQAQILDLLAELSVTRGTALVLITHDLAVVAERAQRVLVMYAGEVLETGPLPEIFAAPRNPYTQALLAALPERNVDRARLAAIPGMVPSPRDRPPGCVLSPRCAYAVERCRRERPQLQGEPARASRCHFPLGADGRPGNYWRPERAEQAVAP